MKYNLSILEKLWQKYSYKQGDRYMTNRQKVLEDYFEETGQRMPTGSFNNYTRKMDLKMLYETKETTFNERTDRFIDEPTKPLTEKDLILKLGFSPDEFELRADKKVGTINHWWLDRGSLEERIRNGQIKIDLWRKQYNLTENDIIKLIEDIGLEKPQIDLQKDESQKDGMLLVPYKDMHFPANKFEDYKEHQQKTLKEINQGWEEINFIIGSDLFQSNNSKGQTYNETQVDFNVSVDEYFAEARKFYIPLLNQAIIKGDRVRIIFEEGNHDKDLALTFVIALKWVYEDQIEFIIDEHNPYQFIQYKGSFIGTHHGDKKIKPKAVGEVFYRYYSKEIGEANYAEVLIGHIHHSWSGEFIKLFVQGLSTNAKDTPYEYTIGKAKGHKAFVLRMYDDYGLSGTKLIR